MSKLLTVLSAHDLSCEKQDRILFEHIHLDIHAGDFLLLRGENGAGKTSLLRILVGLSAPHSGKVSIEGFDVHREINQASQKLLYFGHKLGLSALLSAMENLDFWCKQHAYSSRYDEILNVLELLGLEGLENLAVKHLSQGQQRKVALARMWLSEGARLWVLDEPLTALDVGTVALVENKIERFLATGGSVIMTSHQALSINYPQRELHLEYRW